VDIAVLLDPEEAKAAGSFAMSDLHLDLERLLGKDVDLINLRQVNTVFRHEIIQTGRVLFCRDRNELDHFEVVVMGMYQKLNEERKEIIEAILKDGRVLVP
jgi:uncharacterized protein